MNNNIYIAYIDFEQYTINYDNEYFELVNIQNISKTNEKIILLILGICNFLSETEIIHIYKFSNNIANMIKYICNETINT